MTQPNKSPEPTGGVAGVWMFDFVFHRFLEFAPVAQLFSLGRLRLSDL